MGSHINELNDLLKGEQDSPNKGTQGAEGVGASGLNQLSDAAAEIEVKPSPAQAAALAAAHATAPPALATATMPQQLPSMTLPSQGFSQEQLIEAAQPMQFQQPSQPDIPPPIIPESQGGSQQMHLNAEEAKNLLNANQLAMNDPYLVNQMLAAGINPMGVATAFGDMLYNLNGYNHTEEDNQQIGSKTSKGKKQTRRGPMDEMRQLIRILVKVFPHSIAMISNTDEAGGGNRISEDQIRNYLERAMGDAPKPAWGVPNGWNGYLAEVFSWATGKVVTGEECKKVARREPGRSWESVESELHNIGVHPNCWPLPLTVEGIRKAEEKPIPMEIPKMPPVKRSAPATGGESGGAGPSATMPSTSNKRARSAIERDLNKMDETDLWKFINEALKLAVLKNNTAQDQGTIETAKINAKTKIDEIFGGPSSGLSSMYQYIPVMAGLNGLNDPNLLNLMQNAGMAGFDANDPGQAAALAAAAAAAAGSMDSNMAAAAAAAAAAGAGGAAGGAPAKRFKLEGEEAAEGTPAHDAAAAAASGAQLGTLPMQPPPLNVPAYTNFQNLAPYMTIPGLNVSMPGASAGMPAPEVAHGAPAAAQPEQH